MDYLRELGCLVERDMRVGKRWAGRRKRGLRGSGDRLDCRKGTRRFEEGERGMSGGELWDGWDASRLWM